MKKHTGVLPFLGILFFLVFLCGCKKETPLPGATRSGANTLGCKINGKAWVAQDSDEPFNRAFGVEGGYQGAIIDSIRNCIWILARRNDRTFLHLYVRQVDKPGLYPLRLSTGARPGALVPYSYGLYYDSSKEFMTDPRHTGSVTITRADTVNKIISGSFEFTGYDAQTKQTISITDGRFDARVR
jgi:Family of unknown function (DUF6252)